MSRETNQELNRPRMAREAHEEVAFFRQELSLEVELRLIAEDLEKRAQGHDPRDIAREVDAAVREVRRRRKLHESH